MKAKEPAEEKGGGGAESNREGGTWQQGEQRIVAFVDIIGFGATIRRLNSAPEGLPRVVEALLGGESTPDPSPDEDSLASLFARQEGGQEFALDRQYVFFSDCALVSARCVPGASDEVLAVVLKYARHLLKPRFGFALRGGIARGLAVHRGSLVVGPAMLDAYLMERDAARYPRIVIDDDVAREILSISDSPNQIATIRRGEDGLYFLDVLTTLGLRAEGAQVLCDAREVILGRLNEPGPLDVLAKWRWLAAQYNRALVCVRSLGSEETRGKLPAAIQEPGVPDLEKLSEPSLPT